MTNFDWQQVQQQMSGYNQPQKRYRGANVKFFYAYNQNVQKTYDAGRPIFDEVESISIQWPGMDETVRAVEPRDVQEYPEEYARFKAGSEPVQAGTPLMEWSLLPGTAMRELQHMGFRTVEQLAEANDDIKRRIGPLSQFIKKAKEWIEAANAPQNEIVSLREQLERERKRTEKLERDLAMLIQRVNATEGNSMGNTFYVAQGMGIAAEQYEDQDVTLPAPPKTRKRQSTD